MRQSSAPVVRPLTPNPSPPLRGRGVGGEGGGLCQESQLEQPPSFGVARRGMAVLTGGDAGQSDEVTPAEGRPRGGEFLDHRTVILLRVQRAILADAIAEQQIEDAPLRATQLTVALHQGGRSRLVLLLDG